MMKHLILIPVLFSILSLNAAETVKASSFGFDAVNATKCLQKAINSGVKTVVVDNTGKDWIVDPLKLRSNLELVLDENVTIRARHDGFHGVNDCVFSATGAKNIIVRGKKNAQIINQNEYFNKKKYKESEWRHVFSIAGCENVTIRDLALTGSGGDGVYIRDSSKAAARNITLENLTVDQQGRQGVSVISVEKLLISRCTFTNTKGASPEAGIDFEPNHPHHFFVDCVIRDCVFAGNKGAGVEFMLSHLNATSKPVSITVENCRMERNRSNILIQRRSENLKGKILFRNCQLSAPRTQSVVLDFCPDFPICFENVRIDQTTGKLPVFFLSQSKIYKKIAGSVSFTDTVINSTPENPLLSIYLYPAPLSAQIQLKNFTVNGRQMNEIPAWQKYLSSAKQLAGVPAKPDISNLVSPQPGLKPVIRKNNLFFRNHFTMLLDGRKGEEIIVQTALGGVGTRKGSFKFTVKDPAGKVILAPKKAISERNYTIRFTPEKEGLYQIAFGTRAKFKVSSEHRGQAFIPAGERFQFISPRGSFFFEVPAGVKQFTVIAWGDPGEKIAGASLIAPDGKTVCRKKNFDKPEFFTGSCSGEKSEIWEFRIDRAREDVSFLMQEPLNPVIAERPDLMLRKK